MDLNRDFPLDQITTGSVCMEIGVWQGKFTEEILNRNPRSLYLVDPWLFQNPENVGVKWYSGLVAKEQNDMDGIYHNIVNRFSCNEKVKIIKGKSDNILPLMNESFFDWIYIDGNHEEEFVYRDLVNSLRLIKSGGYITGDDVIWYNDENELTVKNALERFIKDYNLECVVKNSQFVIKVIK